MKPKIFIGSSVEGLSVAYSIQQNLTHDADVTVWDQGVFELSKTTIESLLEILGKSDFGVFVFNQDDISIIKKENKNVVRDNVLFEFGLFIGKLGRERVFFIIPSNADLHLPTDLVGITPGKYDPNREDKSLQAATGPVSHQIRLQVKKLGIISSNEETSKEPEIKESVENEDPSWINLFVKHDYAGAIKVLESQLVVAVTEDVIIDKKIWLSYCKFKTNEANGIKDLESILEEYNNNLLAHRGVARIYFWEDYLDRSIKILENAIGVFNNDGSLVKLLSDCYKKVNGIDFSIDFLKSKSPAENIDISLEIVSMFNELKDFQKAREVIHKIYLNFPNNERIRYSYARVALDLELNDIALFFLRSLTTEFSSNSTYWGYLSNCYLGLELYDSSMVAARKAAEISKEKEEWIISNIGNMFKNKGFYTEGIKYLEKGLELNKNSDYAHDRLATSIKLREEESVKAKQIAADGRKSLRQFEIHE
jgi:Predicted nucleotide-binding protein containing TIR -like domain